MISLLGIMIFLSLIIFFLGIYNLDKRIDDLKFFNSLEIKDLKYLERIKMYDPEIRDRVRVDGLYFAPEYYVVWTKGRTNHTIEGTDVHERCHDLIYDDPIHFCNKTCVRFLNESE